jgi:repressor LexA
MVSIREVRLMQPESLETNGQIEAPLLGKRQRAILVFVREYIRQHGQPPTSRDIGDGVGIHASSSIAYHINRLVTLGYLNKREDTNRTFIVLGIRNHPNGKPTIPDLEAELAALQLENRRLREWCRQLERERAWEREMQEKACAG